MDGRDYIGKWPTLPPSNCVRKKPSLQLIFRKLRFNLWIQMICILGGFRLLSKQSVSFESSNKTCSMVWVVYRQNRQFYITGYGCLPVRVIIFWAQCVKRLTFYSVDCTSKCSLLLHLMENNNVISQWVLVSTLLPVHWLMKFWR